MSTKPRKRSAPGTPDFIRLEYTPDRGEAAVLFLSELQGMILHWRGGASYPCLGEEECPRSLHCAKTVWKGYAAALLWRGGQYQDYLPCVWEITESQYDLMQAHDVAGTFWRFWRERTSGKITRGQCELLEGAGPPMRPAAFPIEPILSRVFRSTKLLLGVPCPFSPAQLAEPVQAPPPPSMAAPARPSTSANNPSSEAERSRVREMLRQRKTGEQAATPSTPAN